MNLAAQQLPRRTVLKGLGTAIALPMLEAMLPGTAPAAAAPGEGADASAAPKRLAFFYIPNGAHMPDWTPAAKGADFELPAILQPLAPHRDQLLVLSGLAHDNAQAHGDGPGDHARSASCFLTGVHPFKTDGANIRAGVSVDQIAASQVGRQTMFPSLELGTDRGAQSGNCDSGYSCAYSSNIAWKTESQPLAKEVDPRLVFERLFGSDDAQANGASRAKRQAYRKSILDFARDDARRLKRTLGAADQHKLDEYLTSVREVESRISRVEKFSLDELPLPPRPEGIPPEFAAHVRLLLDLLTLAMQADMTRIATFMLGNAGSNRSYQFIDVPEGHHDLSHHGGDAEKQAKISKINTFHVTQLAYLLERMKSIEEVGGTLLDHSMIVYGSGIGDGNRHNHNDLPILVAGRGGGTIQSGRHVRYPQDTPLANLFVSLLERMDVVVEVFGDSSGRLGNLAG